MKFKRLILSLVVLFCCFCFASCGSKKDDSDAGKQEPVVAVDIDRRATRYVGDMLKDIELFFIGDCTDGVLSWKNENYCLVSGENSCTWIFTPTDTQTYNSKTGVIKITPERELLESLVSEIVLDYGTGNTSGFIGAKLSTVGISCSSNAPEGYTIQWKTPNQVLVSGENKCRWVFYPNDPDYRQKEGEVIVNASIPQQLQSIEVSSNSKLSGYRAFDKIEYDDLIINEVYNAGIVVPVSVSQSNCDIIYETGDCLHQGDTKVTISYNGMTCVMTIDAVGYKIIEKPSVGSEMIYNGDSQRLQIPDGTYYTSGLVDAINAGNYDVTLTIKDEFIDDCRWSDDNESSTTTIVCKIKKADITAVKSEFNGGYDGLSHSSSVSGTGVSTVYYSLTQLSEENYTAGTETPPAFSNSGEYSVYYFAVGDANHNNCAGTLTVKIVAITPTMALKNCYTVYTGNAVPYPSEYVTIYGSDNSVLQNGALVFEYYSDYSETLGKPITKLTGAPTASLESEYYVVVKYAGDGMNYGATEGVAKLFIDNLDNGLYAMSGEKKFAFKDDIYTQQSQSGNYSITGSNQECDNYLEFNVLPQDGDTGLIGVSFSYKYAAGNNIKTGELSYDDGYVLICGDDSYPLSLSQNKKSVELSIGNETKTLQKWEFPSYLLTYSAVTVSDSDYDEDVHTSKNSTIRIYNDYGTIRFIARVNSEVVGEVAPSGGTAEWKGVVKCEIMNNANLLCYSLICYIMSESDGGYKETGNYFKLIWSVTGDGSVTIVDSSLFISNNRFSGIVNSVSDGVTTPVVYTGTQSEE